MTAALECIDGLKEVPVDTHRTQVVLDQVIKLAAQVRKTIGPDICSPLKWDGWLLAC